MDAVVPPTGAELLSAWRQHDDAGLHLVDETTSPDDHGYGFTYVFKREADQTFWEVYGVRSGQGDYHTLRDDAATIVANRVYPWIVSTTDYRNTPQQETP